MKTISITLDADTLKLIEKFGEGDSRSLLIRKAVREYASMLMRQRQELNDKKAYALHKKTVNIGTRAQRKEQALR